MPDFAHAPSRSTRRWAAVSILRGAAALLLLVQYSLGPARAALGNSATLDRLQMPSGAEDGAEALADALEQRASALRRLHDADASWWDGIEVDVPWAAVDGTMSRRRDTWLGIITDFEDAADVLDSVFTIEHEEDDETVVHLDGRELAGLVAFGDHGAMCGIAEIDAEVDEAKRRSRGAPAAKKRRGRPTGSKNKPRGEASAAAAREEAEADGIDPLAGLCDELDGGESVEKLGAKLRQGWEYTEYTGDLADPRLQPERRWGGIRHPRLRRRAYDAAQGKLRAIETFDATFPPEAFEWMHRHLISYSLGDVHLGGNRQPFNWQRRTGQPVPAQSELIAWYATTKVMLLARCPVLREYWNPESECYNSTIAKLFSRPRWEAILTNLHFADRSTDFPKDEAGTPLETCPVDQRNWDIQGFMDLLIDAWRGAVDYTRTLSADEKGYRTKSRRVPGKQRNVAKPARYFMKGFTLAASERPIRGYVFNIKMYGGKGDGADHPDGAKVSYLMRLIHPSMHHNNLTIVYDNYYGGETPVMRFAEVGIDSMCTVNKSAVSHVFEKRESDETYKSGAKAGERKLIPALQPGEFRTAATTATVHDSRTGAARVIQVRTAAGRHVERSAARSECR